jgi:hypothetical protein
LRNFRFRGLNLSFDIAPQKGVSFSLEPLPAGMSLSAPGPPGIVSQEEGDKSRILRKPEKPASSRPSPEIIFVNSPSLSQ